MKKTYSEKLRDPRWQKRRLEIFEKDGWTCSRCGSTHKTLHVHHVLYLPNKNPWEYSDEYLSTLCVDCHTYCSREDVRLALGMLLVQGWTPHIADVPEDPNSKPARPVTISGEALAAMRKVLREQARRAAGEAPSVKPLVAPAKGLFASMREAAAKAK